MALLVLAEDFTAEELSALEDLRAAGLLDADIEQLLQEDYQDYQDYEVVNIVINNFLVKYLLCRILDLWTRRASEEGRGGGGDRGPSGRAGRDRTCSN